jgi:hypothetical protein
LTTPTGWENACKHRRVAAILAEFGKTKPYVIVNQQQLQNSKSKQRIPTDSQVVLWAIEKKKHSRFVLLPRRKTIVNFGRDSSLSPGSAFVGKTFIHP